MACDPSDGEGGDSGGQGSGVDPATLIRIFRRYSPDGSIPSECASDADCPQGEVCFLLAKELGVCDPKQRPAAVTCTPPEELAPGAMDVCGCGGLECDPGLICISLENECSCGPQRANGCIELACESPSDCTNGTVCTPSLWILPNVPRCLSTLCKADADCTDGPAGRCSAVIYTPSQWGEPYLEGVRCVYEGPRQGACNGTYAQDFLGDGSFYYTCPELAH